MRQLALVSCLLTSCFIAGEPPLRCSVEHPGCPEGFLCISDVCTVAAQDLGQAVDMAIDDLAKPTSLCADGLGVPIGTMGAWACPGTFAAGKASAQCKNQKVCGDSTLIPESVCLSVDGFFISKIWGATNRNYQTPAVSQCLYGSAPNNYGFFGCGKGGGVVDAACNGFRAIIICDPTVNKFGCSSTDLIYTYNTNPLNGVLCCP